MPASAKVKELQSVLEQLPQVASVSGITIADNIIRAVILETKAVGEVALQRIDVHDASLLFDFYLHGLGEKSRRLFAPYPLFHTTPSSPEELAQRIADWEKEDDWTAIKMVKEEQIIGVCFLKRFRTENVTSGIAVRDAFLKKGLGYVLQTIIVEQARLLNIRRFHIKVVSDNEASVRLHEKCGFRKTRVLPKMYEEQLRYLNECDKKEGHKVVDRHIVEMVIDLTPYPHE
jgi:RimJ/RimL family protein N-acetyltransferase